MLKTIIHVHNDLFKILDKKSLNIIGNTRGFHINEMCIAWQYGLMWSMGENQEKQQSEEGAQLTRLRQNFFHKCKKTLKPAASEKKIQI